MKKVAKKKVKAAKPTSKAMVKKAPAKPASKAASRPAKTTTSGRPVVAGDAVKDRGRYTPRDVPGTGWAPFRYPPA